MRNIKFLILAMIFIVYGCYTPKEDVSVSDLDLVIVDVDPEFDFNSPQTFYMPDSIQRLGNSEDEDSGQYDDEILGKIRAKMLNAGFTEITDVVNNEPDVVLLVQSVITNTYVISDPCFWSCWGWDPWYPGWGWGPGWGWPYPPVVVGAYSKGTIFINMIDPDAGAQEQEIDQVWLGVVNGLIIGSDQSILTRIDTGIDKAFELSPYLNR